MTAPDVVFGDITLNSINYRIDLQSYRVRDIVDFAPRAATPGGSIVMAELGLYQPLMFTDFRHGFGFMWHTDEMGYGHTSGGLDTRHPGIVMLMTAPVDDTESFVAEGFLTGDINSVEYTLAYGPSLRKRTTAGTWTDEGGYGTINYVLETQNYIHICPDGARIRRIHKAWSDAIESSTDATPIVITATAHGLEDGDRVTIAGHTVNTNANGQWTVANKADDTFELDTSTGTGGGAGGASGTITARHTDGGAGANSTDYRWLVVHGGYIYAGKDARSLIFKSDEEDLSTLYGDAADDPDRIVIGGDLPTIGAITLMGKLLVSREDGLFEIGDDNKARRVLDFSNQISSTNFRFMAIHNNKLIFPIRDTLYMWNGATLSDITPPFLSDVFPFITYGRFDNGVSVGGYLYMTARTNEATYEEHILCFDGVGWHMLAEPCTAGTDEIHAMGYDVTNNYLWYALESGATDLIYYIRFQDMSDFPYANFPTTGTHSLYSSRLDMGFRRVKKSTPSIIVEASNVTSARYLIVYYSIDGASYTEWGGSAQGRITSNGVTTLTNPLAGTNDTLEYNYIKIRFVFVTDSAAQTPVLEGFTLRFIMRPAVLYGHSFQIVAATYAKVGTAKRDYKTVRDIYNAIETARDSTAPITFVDPFGVSHQGYIASVERRAVERHGRRERQDFPDIESVIQINYVEVG